MDLQVQKGRSLPPVLTSTYYFSKYVVRVATRILTCLGGGRVDPLGCQGIIPADNLDCILNLVPSDGFFRAMIARVIVLAYYVIAVDDGSGWWRKTRGHDH